MTRDQRRQSNDATPRTLLARCWLALSMLTMPLVGLSATPEADAELAAGKSRFEKLCVTCHGKAGAGRDGRAPRLQQRPDLAAGFIRKRIVEGKHGEHAMPPWGSVLDAATVDQLVAYVGWLSTHDAASAGAALTPFRLDDAERIAAGRKRFNKTCAGYCHGHDGVGGRAPDFRARPDLTEQFVFDTIYHGREGADVMPPWGDALSEERIWELVAFIMDLAAKPPQ